MTDPDLELAECVTEAQRNAPSGYRLGLMTLGAVDARLPPPAVLLTVSRDGVIVESDRLRPGDVTRERIIETFAALARRAMAAMMASEAMRGRPRKTAPQPRKLSRAEQVLASLDCEVNIEQRKAALKVIEAAIVDAFEAGWNGYSPAVDDPRQVAEAYANDPEQPC